MKKKSSSAKYNIKKTLLKNLKDKKILRVFNEFVSSLEEELIKENKIAIALSGGPDSLALVYLGKCLSLIKNYRVKFFIVDHKLRKESSIEASKIRLILKNFDINCKVLEWNGKKPKSNIQSLARKKRYELLLKACNKEGISHLLFAHHIDDYTENFFIRLLRGSGLKGLTSFGKIIEDKNSKIKILRPLIRVEKKQLIYISKKVFNFYIKDPSNKNEVFQRTRIRKLTSELFSEGLDKKKFNLTIDNLKSSSDVIDFYVNHNISENSKFVERKNTYILNSKFFDQPKEVIFRSLAYIFVFISKNYYPPRGKSIMNLIVNIQLDKFNKSTLGNCCIEKFNQTYLISKENRSRR